MSDLLRGLFREAFLESGDVDQVLSFVVNAAADQVASQVEGGSTLGAALESVLSKSSIVYAAEHAARIYEVAGGELTGAPTELSFPDLKSIGLLQKALSVVIGGGPARISPRGSRTHGSCDPTGPG